MGLLDYYVNDKRVEIREELSFNSNLDLNPDISYFIIYDLYYNKYERKEEVDDWVKYGLYGVNVDDIKSVPRSIAQVYKHHGNKIMYIRLMEEFCKRK